MEKPFFTIKPRMPGLFKYILLAAVPSAAVGLLLSWDAAAWVFILLAVTLLLPRSHSIVVYDNSLIEKELHGRNRFIRKVNVNQIDHYRRNRLGEIVLVDADSRKLLCIESNMTNFDQFMQWLVNHNITQSKEK